ncbi:polysaccharide pyruvyl transferase family protein [Vibrio scophthalmi]|uniref:Pyruvyl transferase n=1 Tax=Vibrio scophthalmi TaxID=45658 RepID=A0A1C7FC96_9VIBR|nr:polysaccharide pyruvyl transferase family protein [Vibrio scophthalmi]ANU37675.1 Pyruvyl transferase [Vibrio scophthalmi]
MNNNWFEHLSYLKSCHSQVKEIIGSGKVCYLDIPFHFNVGDLLIYKGTEKFLQESDIQVVYRSFANNCNFKKVEGCDVILLHGGGNFGDIYDLHQKFRERIIKRFPDKKIICLPQSIHFGCSEELEKSAKIFNLHNDLHLLVRDRESLNIASLFSKNYYLMPDMAHSLHPLVDESEVEIVRIPTKRLKLNRIDIEKVDSKSLLNKCSFDWNQLISRYDIFSYKVLSKISKLASERCVLEWSKQTDNIVFNSIFYFSFYHEVQTDRLHGFLLSYLLGKKVILFDNSYGKNRRYFNTWFEDDNILITIKADRNASEDCVTY